MNALYSSFDIISLNLHNNRDENKKLSTRSDVF